MSNLNIDGSISFNSLTDTAKTVLLSVVYPVGSIYMSINSTSPASFLGGTWRALAEGYTLWTTTTSGQGGNKISAGLPNITGTLGHIIKRNNEANYSGFGTYSGAFISHTRNANRGYFQTTASGDAGASVVSFYASSSNSIYGNSTTVQPPAIKVYAWERIA